jgi:hypothetical protein
MAPNNNDAAMTTQPRSTLLELPTEMLELIASFLDAKELFNLRLSNYEIATKISMAFIDKFVRDLTYHFARETSDWDVSLGRYLHTTSKKMAALEKSPHLANRVQSLTLPNFLMDDDCPYSLIEQVPSHIELLTNLRSLCITEAGPKEDDHLRCPRMFAYAPMPHLESLTILESDMITVHCLDQFAEPHCTILKSVHLNINVDDEDALGEWNDILEVLKCLRLGTEVVISDPCVYVDFDKFSLPNGEYYDHSASVSFTPTKDDEDRDIVRVLQGCWSRGGDAFGGLGATGGLHYVLYPDKLHKALTCMQRNYKELRLRSERASAGAAQSWHDVDIDEKDKRWREV